MSFCSAILLGAGSSRRLGFDKILTPLAGKPVLKYSFEALVAFPKVREIIVVTRGDIRSQVAAMLEGDHGKPVHIIEGGSERQDSVANGLAAVDECATEVLIHDAARPLLDDEIIGRVLQEAEASGAAVCARPATDTLKLADQDGWVEGTVDRSKYWQIETPQIFRKEWVMEAYGQVQEKKLPITDDASALEHAGRKVKLVQAGLFNLKITRPGDWKLLELWFAGQKGTEIRQAMHDLNNQLSPLVGYLPLLAKYGGVETKFLEYYGKFADGVSSLRKQAETLHGLVRGAFPKKEDG